MYESGWRTIVSVLVNFQITHLTILVIIVL